MKCRLWQYGDVASNDIINSNDFKAKLICGSLKPVVALEDTISRPLKKRFEHLQDHFQYQPFIHSEYYKITDQLRLCNWIMYHSQLHRAWMFVSRSGFYVVMFNDLFKNKITSQLEHASHIFNEAATKYILPTCQ